MRLSQILGGAVFAAVSVSAAAQPSNFAAEADAILEAAYRADQPGAAAIVMHGGEVIWSGGRGLADLEAKKPITPQTVFRTGSITKQFVAATVLTLVAEGKVSLDDPLSKFFPDWPQPGARATLRQLLNHSSGIFDYTKIPNYMMSEPTLRPNTTADLLAVIRSQPSRAEPGAAWEYNNGGYVILGAIIEQVTGKPWHEAVIERIARPLGLQTLGYALEAEGRPGTARFYGDENGQPVPARGVHMSVAHGAGGLVASVEDMARWAQALHHGKVVGQGLYAEMTRRAQLTDGSARPYGFGLRLLRVRGRPAFVHGGAGRGVDTGSVYIPGDDVFVAVFSNSDELDTDASMVVQRLAALAVGQPIPSFTPAEVPLAEIEPLFGTYQAERAQLTFFERDGKLYFGDDEEERPVLAAGGDRFFFADGGLMWLGFEREAGGAHVMKIDPPDEAQPIRAVRTGPVPAPFTVAADMLQSYLGTYATEGPVMTVAMGGNGWLTIAPPGEAGIPLRPVSDTEFRADAAGFRVVFHPEGGKTDRLTMYRGARELHGTRRAP
jgi:CubicO group peptidase (beta-lactamase class C family)